MCGRVHRHRRIQRTDQPADADRLAVHAGSLRPHLAEPQRAHPDRLVGPDGRPVHCPGSARDHARPAAGAHRQSARLPPERSRLRSHRAAAAAGARGGRRPAAGPRPRHGPRLPVGLGPAALFDLPWIPLYVAICFAFHVLIGVTVLTGAIILVALTLATEFLSRGPVKAATAHAAARSRLAEISRRNADVLTAMGMSEALRGRWLDLGRAHLAQQKRVNDVAGGLGATGRVLRMALQSAVLGVGALLVIWQEATAGIIIAGSILAGRALAPIDLAIANWKGFVAARQSWGRLGQLLAAMPAATARLELPAPAHILSIETLGVAPPGAQKLVVHDVNFTLKAGSALGVIGPSASGKSSLVRAIVGVWAPARGCVRLDGAAIEQWTPQALGR